MKAGLVRFLKRAQDPLVMEQSWNTQKMPDPEAKPTPPSPGAPQGSPGTGPSKAALDSFAMDIDMPEEMSVSPLQGNPAQPKTPGVPNFGDTFKEKLRRRRAQDYAKPERGGFTYG